MAGIRAHAGRGACLSLQSLSTGPGRGPNSKIDEGTTLGETIREERAKDEAWVRRTVWSMVERNAASHPEREALVTIDSRGMERRITHLALADMARHASQGLLSIGVRRGDHVALWMTNLVEWVVSYFACLRIGAVVVPVSTRLQPEEVAYILKKSRVRHLVMLDRFRQNDLCALLAKVVPEWPGSVPGELASEALPELRNVVVLHRASPARPDAFDWTVVCGGAGTQWERMGQRTAGAIRPEDVALIKFTSGSTGFPKGVVLEQWGIVTNALLHGRRLRVTGQDRWFSMNPFFHAGGSVWGLMTMTVVGGTLVFTEANDGPTGIRLLKKENCTAMTSGRPIAHDLHAALLESPGKIGGIRCTFYWGEDVCELMTEDFGVEKYFAHYGMTELYGPAIISDLDDPVERQHAWWAKPLDGVEFRVVDPRTGAVIRSGIGEAHSRGLAARGYFDAPEESARLIDQDGWVHSQDLVEVDATGFMRFVGRMKLMLKVGGENVAIEEVENVVRRCPGVLEVGIIGVEDARMTEVPLAYVQLEKGTPTGEAELRRWCTERLARYKIPRDFVFVDGFPMTGSQKIDRAALARANGRQPAVGQPAVA